MLSTPSGKCTLTTSTPTLRRGCTRISQATVRKHACTQHTWLSLAGQVYCNRGTLLFLSSCQQRARRPHSTSRATTACRRTNTPPSTPGTTRCAHERMDFHHDLCLQLSLLRPAETPAAQAAQNASVACNGGAIPVTQHVQLPESPHTGQVAVPLPPQLYTLIPHRLTPHSCEDRRDKPHTSLL